MTLLTIHPEARPDTAEVIRDPDQIAERLWSIGVLFERWTAEHAFPEDADQDAIIAAYRKSIDHFTDRYEFRMVDVVSVTPDHPDKPALREKFLSEHTHDDFEVRFFVEGRGIFYLHADEKVFIVLCTPGDLISVPAGTRHWFDMGERPCFRCIRLFAKPEGWIADYTGDPIAEQFPRFETYLATYA